MIEIELKDLLQKTFPEARIEVSNDSHLHSGHAGSPGTGQSHFTVMVITNSFFGQSRVIRHKKINDAVKPLFKKGLHAISIRAMTIDEFDQA